MAVRREYSLLEHVARAVWFDHDSRRCWMPMFVAYFDGSGKLSDPSCHILTVAGFLTTEHKWTQFNRDWRKALDKEGVTEFHMKHFAHSTGEFTGWKGDEPRRIAFIQALLKIVKKWTVVSFSRSAVLKHYRQADALYEYHEHAAYPYVQCAGGVLNGVRKYMERRHPKDPVLYVYEKGDEHQTEFLEFCRTDFPELPVAPVLMEKRWKDGGGAMRYCLPFQAADFIAWEHRKMFADLSADEAAAFRKPLRWMHDNLHGDWQIANAESYVNIVREMKIPRRKKLQ